MLFKSIKRGFRNHMHYVYFKDITVSHQVVSDAAYFTDTMNMFATIYPDLYISSRETAKIMSSTLLGHYALNVAAELGSKTFKKLLSQFPDMELNEPNDVMQVIGNQCQPAWPMLVWGNFGAVALEIIFNIPIYNNRVKHIHDKKHKLQMVSDRDTHRRMVDVVFKTIIPLLKTSDFTIEEKKKHLTKLILIAKFYKLEEHKTALKRML